MGTFILIHGGLHGAWCWYKVTPLLQKAGYTVLTPDLPGHGDDKTPIDKITLSTYVNAICNLIDRQFELVVLVGHSLGGAVITQVAEYRPDRIKKLVYVAGLLLQNGQTSIEPARTLATEDFIDSKEKGYMILKDEAIKRIFYHDCSDEDINYAKTRLGHRVMAPLLTPMQTTPQNFGRVPRIYIQTNQDQAFPLKSQQKLCAALPCQKVISINTSHSPFFSAPEELAKHLILLAT